jgi:hypothetical protein
MDILLTDIAKALVVTVVLLLLVVVAGVQVVMA